MPVGYVSSVSHGVALRGRLTILLVLFSKRARCLRVFLQRRPAIIKFVEFTGPIMVADLGP